MPDEGNARLQRNVRHALPTLSPSALSFLSIALAATLLGTEGLLRRPLLGEMTFASIVLAEHLLLAAFAIPVAFAQRRQLASLSGRDWAALLAIGWGASAGAALLFTKALASGNPTTASLLQNIQPLFVVVLAMVILKERIARFYWPCLAAAMVGAYLLSFGLLDPRSVLVVDDAATTGYALGAAALWGAGTVLGRVVLARLSYVTLTAMRIVLALPFVAIFAAGSGGLDESLDGIADAPIRITMAALGPGLAAVLLFYRGLGGTKASHATLAEFMYPVAALAGNWAVLGVMISATQMLGLLLVLTTLVALAWLSPSTSDEQMTPVPAIVAVTDLSSVRALASARRSRFTNGSCPVRRRWCSRTVSG
jgi:drug/metabolite transporter (DMT)-like permease